MSLAVVPSASLLGVDGQLIAVEAHIAGGLPGYTVVGLPDTAVRESRDRVRAALVSSGCEYPLTKITVNLAPSGLRKSGAGLDLPVALALLAASDQLPAGALDGVGAVGELGLDGSLRRVPGALALVAALADGGVREVIVPEASAAEAALVAGVAVRPASRLRQVRGCLKGEESWPDVPVPAEPPPAAIDDEPLDLADVRGLGAARLALTASAVGGHHLLLVGPPGVGKTMLARRLPSVLPPLTRREAFEVTRIHSAMGEEIQRLRERRPFRAPHHGISPVALIGGGGGVPRPGEVSRAHRGVLFLDELGEFPPVALDALRQPLEERVVRVARQAMALTFPAAFTLVASTNPCPCGLGPPACTCDEGRRARYRRRLSAPLLDRFDLRVLVSPPEPSDPRGESSAVVRARVDEAVARQASRYQGTPWQRNVEVPAGALARLMPLPAESADALLEVANHAGLTGRGVSGIRRVARTLADVDGVPDIGIHHVLLAADLRQEVLA